jgi:hypothetical protein
LPLLLLSFVIPAKCFTGIASAVAFALHHG